MSVSLVDPAVTLLAVLGIIAVVVRLIRAGLAVLRWGVDAFWARETAGARARRGDVTGMKEAAARRAGARRARWGALARMALWTGLLAAPHFTPWPRELYAAYAGLWLAVRGLEMRRRR